MAVRHGALGCQAAAVIFVVLTWIVMAARFYTRSRLTRNIGADDWVMLATAVVFTGFCVLIYYLIWMVLYADLTQIQPLFLAIRLLFAAFQVYIALTLFVKVALTLFFLRLLPRATHPKQRWIIIGTSGIYLVMGVVIFFLSLYDCGKPTHYIENSVRGECITKRPNGMALSYVFAIMNAVTDWIFVAVPVVAMCSMQLTRRKRISAIVLVALGAIGSLCSVVRVGYIHLLSGTPQQIFRTAESMATLSVVEIGLGIVAVSLATLRPLIAKLNVKGFDHGLRSYLGGAVKKKKNGKRNGNKNNKAVRGKLGDPLSPTPETSPGASIGTVAADDDDEKRLQPRDLGAEEKQLGYVKQGVGIMQVHRVAVVHESGFRTDRQMEGGGDDIAERDGEEEQEDDEEEEEEEPQDQEEREGHNAQEPAPARRTGRWSVAPRISMSWWRGSMLLGSRSEPRSSRVGGGGGLA